MIGLIQSGHYYHRIVTWSRHDTAHLELNINHSLTRSWRDNDFISKYRSIQAIWQLFKLKNITKNEDKIFTSNYPRKWHIWVWGHDIPLYTGVCTIQVQHTAELEAILVIWSYGSWIYNYLCIQCLSPLKLWVWILLMVRCTWYNIMWSSLSVTCGRSWFTLGIPISSSNKTDRHDITEILLKVALNTINQTYLHE